KVMLPYILVGAHLPHAVGFSLGKKLDASPAVAVAYFGDGATSRGYFHTALNWASIFRAPVIFVCENNQVAISTPMCRQTVTATFAEKAQAYGMVGERIDGNDPFAVYGATQRALNRGRKHGQPTLLEMVTQRMDTHTTAIGVEPKRTAVEEARMAANDPLVRMQRFLLSEAAQDYFDLPWSEVADASLQAKATEEMLDAARTYDGLDTHEGSKIIAMSVAFHRTPRLVTKYAPAATKTHRLSPETISDATCCDALNVALYDICQYDDDVVLLGEDVGRIGGVFRTVALPEKWLDRLGLGNYKGQVLNNYLPLIEVFGDRCIDTPLDEEGIAGVSVGLALAGKRPILEVQFSGFAYSMMDQIMTQMGRLPHRSAGNLPMPIVVRLPYGSGFLIEHHREEEVPAFLNNPGLTIVCPSTTQDFYALLWAAVASEKTVLFFEPKILYRDQSLKGDLKRVMPTCPIETFGLRVARPGHDVTIATFGSMVHTALHAARLAEAKQISVEVLDIRVLTPLDTDSLMASVDKTGRLVTVHESSVFGGFGSELVATIASSDSLASLLSPPLRVGAPPTHHPSAPFWRHYTPLAEDILAAIEQSLTHEF
ncbi:MAG: thiamine pyrophosphate-dependent enzyme, partial [Candidatus Tectomicrobia bacterium]